MTSGTASHRYDVVHADDSSIIKAEMLGYMSACSAAKLHWFCSNDISSTMQNSIILSNLLIITCNHLHTIEEILTILDKEDDSFLNHSVFTLISQYRLLLRSLQNHVFKKTGQSLNAFICLQVKLSTQYWNVSEMMTSWTSQKGFPLVTVSRQGNQVTLTQEHFLLTSDGTTNTSRWAYSNTQIVAAG